MPAKCRDIAAIITDRALFTLFPFPLFYLHTRVKRDGEIDREGRRELKRIDIRISSTKKVSVGSAAKREKREGCLRIGREWKSEVDVRMSPPSLRIDVEELYRALGTVCLDALSTD